ncbi:hypothetical protein [Oceaniradius stylonematis]|uniref:hypothetical protein n=1 Tax=Oceaniradius stylonematis TaxID=2184161 RepID=UPI00273ED142|nr:hypothetical protein [Oceaniradius stylonematis]
MRSSTIFINEAKFTADDETVDLVIEAIEAAGFTYDETTEGFVSRDFYALKYAEDAAVWGAWGRPSPPMPS